MKRQSKVTKKSVKKGQVKKTVLLTPEKFLVYDYDCDFCSTLAGMCAYYFGVKIVPNRHAVELYPFLDREKIDRDVHYVVVVSNTIMIYTGAEAINRVLGRKLPFLNSWYNHPAYRLLFDNSYKIVKKVRKLL